MVARLGLSGAKQTSWLFLGSDRGKESGKGHGTPAPCVLLVLEVQYKNLTAFTCILAVLFVFLLGFTYSRLAVTFGRTVAASVISVHT